MNRWPMSKVDGTLKFKRLHEGAVIPGYQTAGASGFDFHALNTMIIKKGETVPVPTGIACAVPAGTEMQIRPRSGMSIKNPCYVSNAPGTIDEDYRGEIKIIITALQDNIVITAGDRIAQGVIVPVLRPFIKVADDLDETERGWSGFGSTGK
jgi:dUTP pyrophosphatase